MASELFITFLKTNKNKDFIDSLRKDVKYIERIHKGFVCTWEGSDFYTIDTTNKWFKSYLLGLKKQPETMRYVDSCFRIYKTKMPA